MAILQELDLKLFLYYKIYYHNALYPLHPKFHENILSLHQHFGSLFEFPRMNVYISDFGRYYFIKSITLLSGGRCAISCAVDVLYTYREYITTCKAMILRSESVGAPTMFTDNKFPIVSGKKEAVHITIDDNNNVFTSTPTLSYLLGVLNRKDGANNGN